MTQPTETDDLRRGIGFKIFKGRRLGPLVGPWISSIIFAALAFYVGKTIPALREVTGLVYFMLVVLVVIVTGRWLRSRSGDRRNSDRRKSGNPEVFP